MYGYERFHTYLYGQSFVAETDHKPLESIQLKHLTSVPPRLQRMLLQPGSQMQIADALSRLLPEETTPIPDLNVEIHEVCPQFSNEYLQTIWSETTKDPRPVALNEVVYTGWPTAIKELPSLLQPYWTFQEEISIEDSLLFKGHRIIIPQSLQSEILTKLHTSHQGMEKTKLRARTSVFWRNINRDIDDMTRSCTVCQEFHSKQSKEPLIPTEVLLTIGIDIFFFDDDEYLIIADYYSKYPFVRKLPHGQSNSKTIVNLTKQIFSEQGVPHVVRSDNGPHFQGQYPEFAK